MSFKVIIAGSRLFDDYEFLKRKLDIILSTKTDIEIVSGAARWADKLGEQYATEYSYKLTHFPADWDNLGRRAGFYRNVEMAKYAEALVAFWDGKSKGTKMMIEIAKSYGLKVRIVYFNSVNSPSHAV